MRKKIRKTLKATMIVALLDWLERRKRKRIERKRWGKLLG
jgi:hypothetical protein